MYEVFLSHASEDDKLATRIADLLRGSGIEVFSTEPGFPTGYWSDEVRAALDECEHFWLLLTDNALNRSVYVHHEFGYFWGHHRQEASSEDEVRNIARRLRYFLREGDQRRPGMYQHFQDFPIADFTDPVAIARIIANEIGRDFNEPEDPEGLRLVDSGPGVAVLDGIDDMRVRRASSEASDDYSYGLLGLDVSVPTTLYNISAASAHPKVAVRPYRPLNQIAGGQTGRLALIVEWTRAEEVRDVVQDSYQRSFAVRRPRDPGPPYHPLYVTFETQSQGCWAAVAYMKVERHSRGHPEADLLGQAPYDWIPEDVE